MAAASLETGHDLWVGTPRQLEPLGLFLGSKEGMGCSYELRRTQPWYLAQAPCPCPSTYTPDPAPCPSTLPCTCTLRWHPAPGMPSPLWNPPLLFFLFQVQDFGLKHLLSMGSLRLLSLAGEPPLEPWHGAAGSPQGWGETGENRDSLGDSQQPSPQHDTTSASPQVTRAPAPSPAPRGGSMAGLLGCRGFWGASFFRCRSFGMLMCLGCWCFGVLVFVDAGFFILWGDAGVLGYCFLECWCFGVTACPVFFQAAHC